MAPALGGNSLQHGFALHSNEEYICGPSCPC